MKVDLKSMVLGLSIGLILTFAMCGTNQQNLGQKQESIYSVGRFTIIMPNGESRYLDPRPILLDSQTGATYVRNRDRWFWEIVPRYQVMNYLDLGYYSLKKTGIPDSLIFKWLVKESSKFYIDSLKPNLDQEFKWDRF